PTIGATDLELRPTSVREPLPPRAREIESPVVAILHKLLRPDLAAHDLSAADNDRLSVVGQRCFVTMDPTRRDSARRDARHRKRIQIEERHRRRLWLSLGRISKRSNNNYLIPG